MIVRLEGILMDLVYIGKVMIGMIYIVKVGGFKGNVFFCYIGG